MIDLNKAKSVFKHYISQFDLADDKINRKIIHTYKVVECAKYIAENLKLSQEDIELAELIGLLHDIGRFEQVRQYHTFVDKDSINHGEYGVKILFEEGLIRNFIQEDKYDKIIKNSILNHNRAEIEDGLTDKEILHAKIIRDADKTDIFYRLTIGDKKAIWEKEDLSEDKISDEIYMQFKEDHKINYKDRQTSADILVSHFAYMFDLNFKQTLEIIQQRNYLENLYNRFKFNDKETMKRYNEIYEIAKKYIETK